MLALARALIANPRLILLDEPTEGLAPIVVQRILDVLKEIHRKGLGSCCWSSRIFASSQASRTRSL